MRCQILTSKEQSKPIIPKVKGKIDDLQYVESVLVNRNPVFLVTNTETGGICIEDQFEFDDKIIRPLEKNECGYIPYSFSSKEYEDLIKSKISTEKLLSE